MPTEHSASDSGRDTAAVKATEGRVVPSVATDTRDRCLWCFSGRIPADKPLSNICDACRAKRQNECKSNHAALAAREIHDDAQGHIIVPEKRCYGHPGGPELHDPSKPCCACGLVHLVRLPRPALAE